MPVTRPDGRAADQLRPVTITRSWLDHAEGSVLVEFGRTRVLCAASVTEGVPRWRKGSGLGWVTAEYAMLPRATHTAAITGAYVALADAVSWLGERKKLAKKTAIVNSVAAVSVGVIDGEPRLDLAYEEDVKAGTDINVVCTGDGNFVEVQGTAEGAVFDRKTLDALLDLAVKGCAELTRLQQDALAR